MTDTAYIAETRRLVAEAATAAATGNRVQAATLHGRIAERHPLIASGWAQAALSALEADEVERGVAAARNALMLEPAMGAAAAVLTRLLVGSQIEARGRVAGIWATTTPNQAAAWAELATARQQLKKLEQAAVAAERALGLDPLLVEVRANLAVLRRELGAIDSGLGELRHAAVVAPASVLVWRRLAVLREVRSELAGSETAALRALMLDPDDAGASAILAIIERRTGRLEEALRRLQALPDRVSGEIGRDTVEFELGMLLDRLGQASAAYRHFERGNALAIARVAPAVADTGPYLRMVDGYASAVRPEWVDRWRKLPEASAPVVFMVGFPRSGTTLLDVILDAHPDIRVIEERPVLSELAARFTASPTPLPERLAGMSDGLAARLRAEYGARLDRWAGADRPAIVVDKMPLNTTALPLALRLYPDAKVILSLRHPCDCCLSCFMQPMRINNAMANFTSLDGATALYARVMSIWQEVEATLKPDHIKVRYEDLVGDVEGTARRVIDFLGVDWRAEIIEHTGHGGRGRRIRTPSFRQVSEPIYARALGRWEKYRPQMEPYLDRLAPHIEAFGYGPPR